MLKVRPRTAHPDPSGSDSRAVSPTADQPALRATSSQAGGLPAPRRRTEDTAAEGPRDGRRLGERLG